MTRFFGSFVIMEESHLTDPIRIPLDEGVDRSELFGSMDVHMDQVRSALGVSVVARDNQLLVDGDNKEKAMKVLLEMIGIVRTGELLDKQKSETETLTQEEKDFLSTYVTEDSNGRKVINNTQKVTTQNCSIHEKLF